MGGGGACTSGGLVRFGDARAGGDVAFRSAAGCCSDTSPAEGSSGSASPSSLSMTFIAASPCCPLFAAPSSTGTGPAKTGATLTNGELTTSAPALAFPSPCCWPGPTSGSSMPSGVIGVAGDANDPPVTAASLFSRSCLRFRQSPSVVRFAFGASVPTPAAVVADWGSVEDVGGGVGRTSDDVAENDGEGGRSVMMEGGRGAFAVAGDDGPSCVVTEAESSKAADSCCMSAAGTAASLITANSSFSFSSAARSGDRDVRSGGASGGTSTTGRSVAGSSCGGADGARASGWIGTDTARGVGERGGKASSRGSSAHHAGQPEPESCVSSFGVIARSVSTCIVS